MKKTVLHNYARLIARVGAGVQKGQDVVIFAELDQPEFVTMLVEECYRAGARKVRTEFSHQPLQKLHYRHCNLKTLSQVEEWEKAKMQHQVDTLPCRILLLSEDPDGLKGVNGEKYAKSQQARGKIVKFYRDQRDGKEQWCIAAVPGKAWAKKVFPQLPVSRAVEALWQAILTASRVTDDPEGAWQEHNKNLKERCKHLNDLHLQSLHYTASNGTDFTVGMIPEAVFCGGQEVTASGKVFNPNIPSEECFISPKRGEAEGVVYSSKPLSWQGQIIDEFFFRFEGGKVVDCGAKVGEDLLRKMVNMDEGASYLGECALVPWESPINQTGILFYNTLFDENACCHLALGRGFADTIENCHEKTQEEIRALGVNESIIHEDFMIGTRDLSITGLTKDGKEVPIFRDGTWAF
ncbi:MAG: aminopeptidase [Oscillospiraceae bacterium]|nr:aminopeptidase [Oscillospiraceae bacterium]